MERLKIQSRDVPPPQSVQTYLRYCSNSEMSDALRGRPGLENDPVTTLRGPPTNGPVDGATSTVTKAPSQHRSSPYFLEIVRLRGRWQIVENMACILSTRFVPFYWAWNVWSCGCFALSTTVIFSSVCGGLPRAHARLQSGARHSRPRGVGINCSRMSEPRGALRATGIEMGGSFNPPYSRLGSRWPVSQSCTFYTLSL